MLFLNVLPIKSNPTNSKPNPHSIAPIFLMLSFLMNIKITPIKVNNEKYILIFNEERETRIPVIVVPMFAPIIIAVA